MKNWKINHLTAVFIIVFTVLAVADPPNEWKKL